MSETIPTVIETYIAAAPAPVRPALARIRQIFQTAAPDAEEIISYKMPAFRGQGILVYFAAFKNHIGMYPPISGDTDIEAALAPYTGPKGNLQFRLDQAIPYDLIERIATLRVGQDRAKAMISKRVKSKNTA